MMHAISWYLCTGSCWPTTTVFLGARLAYAPFLHVPAHTSITAASWDDIVLFSCRLAAFGARGARNGCTVLIVITNDSDTGNSARTRPPALFTG